MRCQSPPSTVYFIFKDGRPWRNLVPHSSSIKEVWEALQDDDGALYVQYAHERRPGVHAVKCIVEASEEPPIFRVTPRMGR